MGQKIRGPHWGLSRRPIVYTRVRGRGPWIIEILKEGGSSEPGRTQNGGSAVGEA